MRLMLALGVLAVAVLGITGLLIYDSRRVVRIADTRVDDSLGPVLTTSEMVQRQHRRSKSEFSPEDEERQQYEYWRTPRRGDFWTQGEFYQRYLKPAP